MANTLAYYDLADITAVKSTHGVNILRLFTTVSYKSKLKFYYKTDLAYSLPVLSLMVVVGLVGVSLIIH